MSTAPSADQERFAMLTNRCHRLVRFLHELAQSQSDQVTQVEDNPLVLWLAELPNGLSLFEHATAGEVLLAAPAAAVLPPPPPLPEALAGWVVLPEPGEVPSDAPPLRETSLRAGGGGRGGWPDSVPRRPGGQPVTEPLGGEPVRLADRPEVPAAYQDWLPAWRIWASRARADADRRALHGLLHGVAGRLAQEGDGLELVLATGLLSWRAGGRTLRRHLLTTRLAVEVDPVSSEIRLRLPAEVATRLEDGALLDGVPAFHAERTNALHERLRARPATPLGGDDERLLRDWLALALDVTTDGYSPSWQPPAPPTDRPRIDLAPALVLRRRGNAALLTYYEQMLDALRGDGRPPLGLAQLVETLEADERLAWLAAEGKASADQLGDDPLFPLPANPEQAHVMERLRHDNGVVVEGPPGTGKTHTIANLMSALLAEGQRVLVTSQKAQALRVLREKLPEQLQRLCVSLVEPDDGGGSSQLAASISALAAEKAAYDPAGQARRVEAARVRRVAALARRDQLTAAIHQRRAAEAVGYPQTEVAPGWSGTRGAIAGRARRERAEHDWLPLPVPRPDDPATGRPAPPPPAPLTAREAVTLWSLLRSAAAGGQAGGDRPDDGGPDGLGDDEAAEDVLAGLSVTVPGPDVVDQLVERERAAAADARTALTALAGLAGLASDGTEPASLAGGAAALDLEAVSGMADVLSALDPHRLDRLTGQVEEVRRALAALSRAARQAPWLPRAVDDALAGRNGAIWAKVASAEQALAQARAALTELGLHAVTLPPTPLPPTEPEADEPAPAASSPAARLLAAGEALRDHLAAGGGLRRTFRPKAQRAAQELLTSATVDGQAPTTPQLLDLVLTRLRAEVALEAAASAWALAGVRLAEPGAAPEHRLARLAEATEALRTVGGVLAARDRVRAAVGGFRPGALGGDLDLDLSSTAALGELVNALGLARLRRVAAAARGDVERLRAQLSAAASAPGTPAPAELRRLAGTLADRDVDAYRQARRELVRTLADRQAAVRRAELLDRLRRAHPVLADALVAAARRAAASPDGAASADAAWRARLSRFPQAWSWGLATGWLERQQAADTDAAPGTAGAGGPSGDLDAQLDAAEDAVLAATAELAGARAWRHCLERMGTRESAALRAYADAVAAGGRASGRHAERYRQAAREAMAVAQTAVPAWVMPIADVLSTIPPVRDSFDVVIVDEGSQAGLDSLFLLWLAPRVIIVGDDRQCTPAIPEPAAPADSPAPREAVAAADEVSAAELAELANLRTLADLTGGTDLTGGIDRPGRSLLGPEDDDAEADDLSGVFRRLDALLPDVPGWLRVAFTPRTSLFSLLRTRFGEVVRLREHFRCMPEIIEWSSAMFYRDAPLIPLRQFGTERLPPLRARYVPHAYTTGEGADLRNPAEAEALVSQVLACAADPAYEGRSFGVVVLQGSGQAELLRSLLAARMSVAEQHRRRLRVGTPPDFQGDERDVVFLSMVVTSQAAATPLRRQEYQRRFNVAASRARDQVWLFHSVELDQLDPADLRHSYLSYVLARGHELPELATPPRLAEVAPDIAHPRFDSLFEQRVFRELTLAGYRVLPQVEVNGRRIDLVVTGGRARLAVECDGEDAGTPEQVAHDFARERQLRRAGWPFWRIRQSDFEADPAAALAPLWPRLAAAGIEPSPSPAEEGGVTAEDVGAGAGGTTWAPIALSELDGLDDAG